MPFKTGSQLVDPGDWDGLPSSIPPTSTPAPTPTPTRTPTAGPTPTNPPTATPTPVAVFSSAAFTYDGDGKRVKSAMTTNLGTTTTYFVGAHYESTNSVISKYYYAGAQRIAMRNNGTVFFTLGDHLGSTSLTTFANGSVVSELRYKAWGEVRYASGNSPTKYQYTGQFSYESDFGLYFYNARWYDSSLGRFAQADTVISGGVQGYDRYAYSSNNPIRYIDPTGHKACDGRNSGGSCETLRSIRRDLLDYGVRLAGDADDWIAPYQQAVLSAVEKVGNKFASVRQLGETAAQAFREVYTSIEIEIGDCGPCNGAGGYTHSAHHIEFDSQNPFYDATVSMNGDFNRTPSLAFELNVHNVIHELGHAFATLWTEKGSTTGPYSTKMLTGFFGDVGFATPPEYGGKMWRMHPFDAAEDDVTHQHEAFADMFLGWTYDTWGSDSAGIGANRSTFMTTNMAEWLSHLP